MHSGRPAPSTEMNPPQITVYEASSVKIGTAQVLMLPEGFDGKQAPGVSENVLYGSAQPCFHQWRASVRLKSIRQEQPLSTA